MPKISVITEVSPSGASALLCCASCSAPALESTSPLIPATTSSCAARSRSQGLRTVRSFRNSAVSRAGMGGPYVVGVGEVGLAVMSGWPASAVSRRKACSRLAACWAPGLASWLSGPSKRSRPALMMTARSTVWAISLSLILTTFEIDEYVFQALRCGASGFIGKSAQADELLAAIRVISRGEALLSPAATRALIARYLAFPRHTDLPQPGQLTALTNREREVVALVAAG